MNKIPKIFHRYWEGEPMPEIFKYYGKTWENHHPGWKMILWTKNNLPDMLNQNLYNQLDIISPRSDVVRYEVLYKYGGVYIDTDFECYKNIEELLNGYELVGCGEAEGIMSAGFIGSIPNHPFIKKIIDEMPIHVAKNPNAPANELTGPLFITEKVYKTELGNMIKMFPTRYFYPIDFPVNDPPDMGYKYPNAYANHHWAASWLK